MQELVYLTTHFPNGTLESGIEKTNELYWNLSVEQFGKIWRVLGGDQVMFWSDNRESIDAFLYGLCIAYCAIPEEAFDKLKQTLKEIIEYSLKILYKTANIYRQNLIIILNSRGSFYAKQALTNPRFLAKAHL